MAKLALRDQHDVDDACCLLPRKGWIKVWTENDPFKAAMFRKLRIPRHGMPLEA